MTTSDAEMPLGLLWIVIASKAKEQRSNLIRGMLVGLGRKGKPQVQDEVRLLLFFDDCQLDFPPFEGRGV